MLGFLGLGSLDELFGAIPAALRLAGGLDLADGHRPSPTCSARCRARAAANAARADQLVCFAGAGAYDHEVPPVVRALAGRSEFVTSYTPYQPEVAQGGLQAIFEFQTMVSRLFGLPIANASLYDGATRTRRGGEPRGRGHRAPRGAGLGGRPPALAGRAGHLRRGHRPSSRSRSPLRDGVTDWDVPAPPEDVGVVVVGYPNYLGCLEDLGGGAAAVRRPGRRSWWWRPTRSRPGCCGARVSGARTSRSGRARPSAPRSPSAAPISDCSLCRLPTCAGSRDAWSARPSTPTGALAYVTTLRAREQDIRREKATSNVCTNQTLMALTAAVQLGWLGTTGTGRGGDRAAPGAPATAGTRWSPSTASSRSPASTPVLREFAPPTARSEPPVAIERLAEEGFLAGVALDQLAGRDGDGSVGPDDRRPRAPRGGDRAAHQGPRSTGSSPRSTRRSGERPPAAGPPARPSARARHRADHLRAVPSGAGPAGSCRRPGIARDPDLDELVPEAHRRGRAGPNWPRCPSATSSAISPGSATASTRSTSVPTRSGRCTMKYNPKVCDAVAGSSGPSSRYTRPPRPRSSRAGWPSWWASRRRCAS